MVLPPPCAAVLGTEPNLECPIFMACSDLIQYFPHRMIDRRTPCIPGDTIRTGAATSFPNLDYPCFMRGTMWNPIVFFSYRIRMDKSRITHCADLVSLHNHHTACDVEGHITIFFQYSDHFPLCCSNYRACIHYQCIGFFRFRHNPAASRDQNRFQFPAVSVIVSTPKREDTDVLVCKVRKAFSMTHFWIRSGWRLYTRV